VGIQNESASRWSGISKTLFAKRGVVCTMWQILVVNGDKELLKGSDAFADS